MENLDGQITEAFTKGVRLSGLADSRDQCYVKMQEIQARIEQIVIEFGDTIDTDDVDPKFIAKLMLDPDFQLQIRNILAWKRICGVIRTRRGEPFCQELVSLLKASPNKTNSESLEIIIGFLSLSDLESALSLPRSAR